MFAHLQVHMQGDIHYLSAHKGASYQEDKSMAFLTTTASALSLFSQLFMLLSRMAKLFGVFA